VEFQFGLIVAGCCVDISGVLVQRNDGCVGDEDVSKAFETSVQVGSSGVEILDSVIENLSKECNKARFEPVVERRVREFIAVSHFDVAFEKRLQRAV
jgi:hypothetical protein